MITFSIMLFRIAFFNFGMGIFRSCGLFMGIVLHLLIAVILLNLRFFCKNGILESKMKKKRKRNLKFYL